MSSEAASADDLRGRLAGWDITELLLVRNWQEINTVAIGAFPDARRVIYGDAFGHMNPVLGRGHAEFHEAMAMLPFEDTPRALDGLDLRVVDRDTMLSVVERTRATLPELVDQDAELARFVGGGALLLGSYLTEVRSATRSGEIRHLLRLFDATHTPSGAPVLIKPHPRASLGQVGAVARILRARGHSTRVVGRENGGLYPIELFSAVAGAVRTAEGGASATIVALRHLYGVDARATDDYAAHPVGFSVEARRRLSALTRTYNEQLSMLESWDGASSLPAVGSETPRLDDWLRARLWRFVAWRPTRTGSRRSRQLASLNRGGGPSCRERLDDERNGFTWWLDPQHVKILNSVERPKDPRLALRNCLEAMAQSRSRGNFELVAVVSPQSHLPALESLIRPIFPLTVDARATMTAEEVEDQLEIFVDVLDRRPVSQPHRHVPEVGNLPSRVRFVASLRAS